jgi:hypothetical protein
MMPIDPLKSVSDSIDQSAPEFDPTSPTADYGEEIRTVGDAVLNIVTEGAAGNAFSESSQLIQDINEISNNAFAVDNIGETAKGIGEAADSIVEDLLGSLF